jgi:ABC-type phosphate/phosphonate transport system substrate-binding protein
MTSTSAVLPVPGLIEQNKHLTRAKQKQATFYCLAMLGERRTKQSRYCSSQVVRASSTGEGIAQEKS